MRAGLALVVAVSTAATLVVASPAQAQTGTLHVNQVPGCSDSGPGTATTPYCTLQAAADVVEPGQTIDVGFIRQAAVFTRSGTEDAPITLTGHGVDDPGGPRGPVITLDHVAHVVIRDLRISPYGTALHVDGGSHVTIDELYVGGNQADGVRITDATDVVLRRSTINVEGRPLHVAGGARVTVTGNVMERYRNLGVLVESTTDAAITGNTIAGVCVIGDGVGVEVTGATTVSVQNNIIAADCSGSAIKVDAAAAPGTTVDYNVVDGWPPYVWGDVDHYSPASLHAATGQGAHDSDADPARSDVEVDSGNADAPGVLDPAYEDKPRVDNLLVADTGSGAYTYLDRGAREAQDRFTRGGASISATRAPVSGDVTVTSDPASLWGSPFTCAIDFGDGTTAQACTTAHAYSAPGTYTVRYRATSVSKLVSDWEWQVTVVPAGGAMTPTLTVAHYGAVTARFSVDLGPSYPWSPKSIRFDAGEGGTWESASLATTHSFERPGTYPVTVTITDAAGDVATAQATYTTHGSGFVKYGPARFLDTRTGSTARKVAPNATVRMAVGGQRGVPADATAVIVNVTATNPSASGFVTAYPDGAPRPAVSTLNYTAGRTVSNPATVTLGTGGYLNLFNGSGGTVDLVADVLGYYVRGESVDAMTQLWPQRVLDTRTGHGQEAGVPAVIPAGGTVSPVVATASPSDLAPGEATSVVLNVTVVNPAAAGFVTAYPAGTARPMASNVNFAAGETIGKAVTVPVGQDGRVSFYAHARTDLIVTILGYYAPGGDGYFVPVRPERAVDTRTSGTPLAPRADVTYRLDGNAPPPQFGVTPQSVVSNVTVVNARRSGYLIAYALAGAAESTLNFTPAGGPVSNMALTGGSSGTFHNGSDGTVDLLVDVSGYFFTG